jgi:hypothetical protein
LEPQLRNPGGTGTGTPFAAFAGESGSAEDAPADDTPSTHETGVAATFLAATRRRRRHRFGD